MVRISRPRSVAEVVPVSEWTALVEAAQGCGGVNRSAVAGLLVEVGSIVRLRNWLGVGVGIRQEFRSMSNGSRARQNRRAFLDVQSTEPLGSGVV